MAFLEGRGLVGAALLRPWSWTEKGEEEKIMEEKCDVKGRDWRKTEKKSDKRLISSIV